MAKINVPKPAKGSFNPDRPISDLLRSQLRHLHEVEKRMPHLHRTGRNVEEIKTEKEASDYIAKVTARLHVRGAIKVPRPVPGSFHKHRPISDLLKSQIKHFHEAEKSLAPGSRTGVDVQGIKTEHEAAAYIEQVTKRLHAKEENGPAQQPTAAPAIRAENKPGGKASGAKATAEKSKPRSSAKTHPRKGKG